MKSPANRVEHGRTRRAIAGVTVTKVSLVTMLLALPLALTAQDPEPPLFAAHETLDLTIEADFDRIHKDRGQESEYQPAKLFLADMTELPLRIRTRGLFRLKRSTCQYPPLRLNFPTKSLVGTVFEGQNRLKLVTHCQDKDSYEQNTIEEYLAYRIYNLLSDVSFRVRLARITYVDSRGEDDPIERFGVLLEDEDAMATRLGGTMVEVPQAGPNEMVGRDAARVALFQYLIGNTDYSQVFMHNSKLMQTADYYYITVPYDFDWSGLVDASYATPADELTIREVRQRQFRGFCRPEIDLDRINDEFRALRQDFEDLFTTTDGLDDKSREDGLDYLAEFYEVINNENAFDRHILSICRKIPS